MKPGNHLLWLILAGIGLQSCMTSTTLQVLQPAEMRIPEHITTIATIDRSKPSSGFINVIEGLFTGEAIGQDKRGRLYALDGLTHSLTRTPRFQVKSTDIELEGTRTANFMAEPIAWSEIESICQRYDADAVLAIEQYDSDAIVTTRTFQDKYSDKEGEKQSRTIHEAIATLDVTIGWRLYDPANKVIEDEFSVYLDETYAAEGDREKQARANLPDPVSRSFNLSYNAGQRYGMRIAPVWITVPRSFFPRGKGIYQDRMKQAARYVKGGNWEEAIGIWTELVDIADPKTAGRAAHNLAIASERIGKLEAAVEWAEKAWFDFGIKSSRNYLGVLRNRIEDDRRVRSQLPTSTIP